MFAGGVEEDLGADDVGADERAAVVDAAVYVALGREVDDRVGAAGGGADGLRVGHVALDETVAGVAGEVGEVGEVAGVGEAVEVQDGDGGVGLEQVADEVAADEAAAAGHEHKGHGSYRPEVAPGRRRPAGRPGGG